MTPRNAVYEAKQKLRGLEFSLLFWGLTLFLSLAATIFAIVGALSYTIGAQFGEIVITTGPVIIAVATLASVSSIFRLRAYRKQLRSQHPDILSTRSESQKPYDY